jgi:hypothetical protein
MISIPVWQCARRGAPFRLSLSCLACGRAFAAPLSAPAGARGPRQHFALSGQFSVRHPLSLLRRNFVSRVAPCQRAAPPIARSPLPLRALARSWSTSKG